jgi:uncharacterized membrane protein
MGDAETTSGSDAPAEQERRSDPGRVLALTDGVFAIIITILVLDIRIPENLAERSIAEAVGEVAPTLTAWVISFLVTAMYWVWHRDTFAAVRRVDRDLVWLNLAFLLPVSLIPFAASVLGAHDREPVALHVYGTVLIAASVMRVVLYAYLARRPQLLWERPSDRTRKIGTTLAAAPIAVYGLAMLLADAAPVLSLALYGFMPILYFVGVTLLRDRSRFRADAEDFS